jgi:hypothetical protein
LWYGVKPHMKRFLFSLEQDASSTMINKVQGGRILLIKFARPVLFLFIATGVLFELFSITYPLSATSI